MFEKQKSIQTDVLIIGSGAAGLRAAIEARRYRVDVLVVDKAVIGLNNNSRWAGGGLKTSLPGIMNADYLKIYNTPEEHFRHMVKHGHYLCDQRLAEVLAFESPGRILELQEFGVEHFRDLYYKVPYPHGTGMMVPFIRTIKQMGVRTRHQTFICDFLKRGDEVVGAVGFDTHSGDLLVFQAKAVILATGGGGEIYERNDTTVTTTGDGFAMAFRAGAELRDMEISQFEPYVQAEPELPMMDRHECQAEFYGVLKNSSGEEFLHKYIPRRGAPRERFDKEFGAHVPDTRELISRAMAMEVYEGRGDRGSVLFDLRDVSDELWRADLASIYTRKVLLRGFDVKNKLLHVFPGCICNLGGVAINEACETTLGGLFAAGEATGGIHGASRLGGAAVTDCIVFGARAGRSAALRAMAIPPPAIKTDAMESVMAKITTMLKAPPSADVDPLSLKKRIKSMMWKNVGIIRDGKGLKQAVCELIAMRSEVLPRMAAQGRRGLREALEAINMLTTAEMVARSALYREDSRGGGHYRLDFPQRDDKKWLVNIFIKAKNGDMELTTRPVVITRLFPD